MQIQINTDNNIAGHEALSQEVEAVLRAALDRFSDKITRLEVHLSDVDSAAKSGTMDKRCVLEARLSGWQPLAVHEQAATIDQAVSGAASKMVSLLESEIGKRDTR